MPKKKKFQSNVNIIWQIESNIHASVLLNINLLPKSDKMLDKPPIFFSTSLINSIIHEHSCKILFVIATIQGESSRQQLGLFAVMIRGSVLFSSSAV